MKSQSGSSLFALRSSLLAPRSSLLALGSSRFALGSFSSFLALRSWLFAHRSWLLALRSWLFALRSWLLAVPASLLALRSAIFDKVVSDKLNANILWPCVPTFIFRTLLTCFSVIGCFIWHYRVDFSVKLSREILALYWHWHLVTRVTVGWGGDQHPWFCICMLIYLMK